MSRLEFFREEKGSTLLSLLVSVPLLTVMLIGLATFLCFGIKRYVYLRGNYELIEQVRTPLERIVRDLNVAEQAMKDGNRLWIYTRNTSESPTWNDYMLVGASSDNPRISRNSQPLTGDSKLGDIRITKFDFSVEGRTVFVEISGKNMMTEREYTLKTAVTMPERDGAS